MKSYPKVIGMADDGTEIVEIRCSLCDGDQVEPVLSHRPEYVCLRCDTVFRPEYPE